VVAPEIQAAVTFRNGNLLEDSALESPGQWDIVFCRNVLMYFTDDRADALIARFARCLAPGGYLFLGHAESLRGRGDDFALCHTHGAFYYQRQPATQLGAVAASPATTVERGSTDADTDGGSALQVDWHGDIHAATRRVHAMVDSALDRVPAPSRGAAPVVSPAPGASPGPDAPGVPGVPGAPPDLGEIRELFTQERFGEALARLDRLRAAGTADGEAAILRALVLTHSGRFAEARMACNELLAADAGSAGANYLLALCCDSTGDLEGAVRLAKLAARLDPSFAMPRVHLGLLARRTGDREIAWHELTRAITLLESDSPSRLALYGGGFSRHALLGMCRAELAAIGAVR
jgi:chemotaxis protein methyltransferase CheR